MQNETCVSKTKQVTGITAELSNMDGNLDRLEKSISELFGKLGKILLPGSEELVGAEIDQGKSSTELRNIIQTKNNRFNSLINELTALNDRIDL